MYKNSLQVQIMSDNGPLVKPGFYIPPLSWPGLPRERQFHISVGLPNLPSVGMNLGLVPVGKNWIQKHDQNWNWNWSWNLYIFEELDPEPDCPISVYKLCGTRTGIHYLLSIKGTRRTKPMMINW
jgi:hypothetical protein